MGKTIRLYLVNGTPTGILRAELSNWTGQVIASPRSKLSEVAQREEAKRTGVYLLVGQDPDQADRIRVYVGEGDSVLKRLTSHNSDRKRDFWTKTIIIVSKDENLTKSHVRFLESRMIELILSVDRAIVDNDTKPAPCPLPEPDIADMEFFLEQTKMILPILGFDFMQPKPALIEDEKRAPRTAGPIFILEQVGVLARAIEVDGEFVVLRGSTARKTATRTWITYRAKREQLVHDGLLVDHTEDNYRFKEDVAFPSPSSAANTVLARQANGRTEWKMQDTGQTYADWQASQLPVEFDEG